MDFTNGRRRRRNCLQIHTSTTSGVGLPFVVVMVLALLVAPSEGFNTPPTVLRQRRQPWSRSSRRASSSSSSLDGKTWSGGEWETCSRRTAERTSSVRGSTAAGPLNKRKLHGGARPLYADNLGDDRASVSNRNTNGNRNSDSNIDIEYSSNGSGGDPDSSEYKMDKGWMGETWQIGGGLGGVSHHDDRRGVVPAEGIVEATADSVEAAAEKSVPLKVMVFIDGTWLYYSFFGRGERCHVSAKLGPGWIFEYKVKWEMLPVIISRALHAQLAQYNQPSRLVEVVRTVVFSSARRDTDRFSYRMQMFNSMREKNFEVHMATTVGVQEKCIDIALAVEMMHYATIPDTYDVGVLVTGDKDFMPAMSRTRQKGRRVCLCSMRNSCNQDLLRDDAHVMDFAPVWINEHLDDMMEYAPSSAGEGRRAQARVSPEVLCEVIIQLMERAGGTIFSRDLGRALNVIKILDDGTKALEVIKESWGSLTKFLGDQNDVFQMGKTQPDPDEPAIKQFSISMVDRQNSMKSVKLGEVMDDSASEDSSDDPGYDADDSEEELEREGGVAAWDDNTGTESRESLMLLRVPQLKERLRDHRLPLSGNKAVLVERILESATREVTPPTTTTTTTTTSTPLTRAGAGVSQYPERYSSPSPTTAGSTAGSDNRGTGVGSSEGWAAAAASAAIANSPLLDQPGTRSDEVRRETPGVGIEEEGDAKHRRMSGHAALVNLVGEIVDAGEVDGGMVSSRDIGRELSRTPSPHDPNTSALIALKARWPSLMAFLRACPSEFAVENIGHEKEFLVVRKGPEERNSYHHGGGGGGGRGMAGTAATADGRHNFSRGGRASGRYR